MSNPQADEDPIGALASMANRRDDPSPPAGPEEAQADTKTAQESETAMDAEVVSVSGGEPSRRLQQAAYNRLERRVHAEQFKRIMIPVLVVLSALLVVVGLMSLAMTGGRSLFGLSAANSRLPLGWLSAISLVIAFVLAIGAYAFGRDLKGR